MDNISCELCLDLIPLVRDGVASGESQAAVEEHIRSCEDCAAAFRETEAAVHPDRALEKAVKRVKRISVLVMLLLVGMGIFLCETVVRGSSVFFVLVVLVIRGLLTAAAGSEKSRKGKIKRWTAVFCAGMLIIGLLALGNALVGNPVSALLARKAAENYLAGKFPEENYQVTGLAIDAKRGHYQVSVQLENSQDCNFTIDCDMLGNVHHDTYTDVVTGWNTAERLADAYWTLVKPQAELLRETWPGASVHGTLTFESKPYEEVPYAQQYFYAGQPLEPDGDYDLREVGQAIGQVILWIESDEVTEEKAAEILLEVRRQMDRAVVPFAYVNLMLRHSDPEARKMGSVYLESFPREEIREEGLLHRIREANQG